MDNILLKKPVNHLKIEYLTSDGDYTDEKSNAKQTPKNLTPINLRLDTDRRLF